MKRRLKAVEVDHIAFACRDRHHWQEQFERFGFRTLSSQKFVGAIAMSHGNVRIVLTDPESDYHLLKSPGAAAAEAFLEEHGDIQIRNVALRVKNIEDAIYDLGRMGAYIYGNLLSYEDSFGFVRGMGFVDMKRRNLNLGDGHRWYFIERPKGYSYSDEGPERSTGVDHFAIAVSDIEEWEKIYHFLGFETIYEPDLIKGRYSGMKTLAVQRDNWTVALVEGADGEMPSQVTNYHEAHGEHSVQHAALNFKNLPSVVKDLQSRGVQFRMRRDEANFVGDLTDVMHEGVDHSGPLFQCFTKPWAMNDGKGGFFFEIIRRLSAKRKFTRSKSAFDDQTVIGLYESIEREEMAGDTTLVFSDLTN